MLEGALGRAIVTGGSRGIGYAIARRLVTRGSSVILVARNDDRVAAAAGDLSRQGPGRALGLATVITGEEAVAERIVAFSEERLGGVDILINAAGGATVATALEASWETWRRDFETKFWGYLALMRAVVPAMERAGGGVAVNVLGVSGKDPNPELAIASAINGALRNAVKVLADEVSGKRIRVVNVNPGATETDLLTEMATGYARRRGTDPVTVLRDMRGRAPLGRLATPDDIAAAVEFLLSPQAALITGTSLDVDGGRHRGPA